MARLAGIGGLLILLATVEVLPQTSAPSSKELEAFVGAYDLRDGTVARIVLRGGSLIADAGLGPTTRLKPLSDETFESEGSEPIRLTFVRGSGSEPTIRVTQGSRTRQGQRIAVPRAVLAKYVGRYPLSADLAMVVTLEGERLIAQATGQSRHPLFPESSTTFFVQDYQSEDLAQLEFGSGAEGSFVVFRQGGVEQKVIRK